MTIEKRVSYLGGWIYAEGEIIPPGDELQFNSGGLDQKVEVVDSNELIYHWCNDKSFKLRFSRDEINNAAIHKGPSNFWERIIGQKTEVRWKTDLPSGGTKNLVQNVPFRLIQSRIS